MRNAVRAPAVRTSIVGIRPAPWRCDAGPCLHSKRADGSDARRDARAGAAGAALHGRGLLPGLAASALSRGDSRRQVRATFPRHPRRALFSFFASLRFQIAVVALRAAAIRPTTRRSPRTGSGACARAWCASRSCSAASPSRGAFSSGSAGGRSNSEPSRVPTSAMRPPLAGGRSCRSPRDGPRGPAYATRSGQARAFEARMLGTTLTK